MAGCGPPGRGAEGGGSRGGGTQAARRGGGLHRMRWPWTSKAKLFEELALPHLAALYRGARSLSDEQTADDLVQETYLRAWKYFSSFDPATNCRAWLFRILRNVWADRWRK